MEAKETCNSCKFWKLLEAERFGECRRHSPRPSGQGIEAKWPGTTLDDWCGDYQPKPNEDAAQDAVDFAKTAAEVGRTS